MADDDDLPDLEIKLFGSGLVRVSATREAGVALLRSLVNSEDPPTEDDDGSVFVLLPIKHLEDIIRRAKEAGLSVAPIPIPKSHLSS
jgi:hypothetical protein